MTAFIATPAQLTIHLNPQLAHAEAARDNAAALVAANPAVITLMQTQAANDTTRLTQAGRSLAAADNAALLRRFNAETDAMQDQHTLMVSLIATPANLTIHLNTQLAQAEAARDNAAALVAANPAVITLMQTQADNEATRLVAVGRAANAANNAALLRRFNAETDAMQDQHALMVSLMATPANLTIHLNTQLAHAEAAR